MGEEEILSKLRDAIVNLDIKGLGRLARRLLGGYTCV